MYKITEIRLEVDGEISEERIKDILSKKYNIPIQKILSLEIDRLSLDARKKDDIHYKCNVVCDIVGNINTNKHKNISLYSPASQENLKWFGEKKKVIVVGSGPSGLFTALTLTSSGLPVVLLERGYEMSKRKMAVQMLMEDGVLDKCSNIQFGEGGAGTFSDGKLNTGIKSPLIAQVLDTFCQFGGGKEIKYSSKPHLGTDILEKVVVNIRKYLESKGTKILFEHTLTDIDKERRVIKVENGGKHIEMDYDELVLAIGHSSRDTIRRLNDKGMAFKRKPFSLGFRIEHKQSDINYAQYGDMALRAILPPADYHLSTHVSSGRCVYTFCMCPGGVVVPATSEDGHIVTNGMSYSDRGLENANSAILVSISPEDFPGESVLGGIDLQEDIEKVAYEKTKSFFAPVQRVEDFLIGRKSTTLKKVFPSYKPGYYLDRVDDILPAHLTHDLREGIIALDKKLKGFADKDAILTGVETRSSAPYQIIRDNNMQTNFDNVYMIGEGGGMAGGIVSSAVEGIKVGKIIISKYNNL